VYGHHNSVSLRCSAGLRLHLRVEHAQSLLDGDGHDIEAIAAEVAAPMGAKLQTPLREQLGGSSDVASERSGLVFRDRYEAVDNLI
jgi:hypothetical protein